MMKRLFLLVSFFALALMLNEQAQAQFLKNLKEKVEQAKNGGNQETQEENAAEAVPEHYDLKLTGSGSDLQLNYRMDMDMESTQGYQVDMDFKMYIIPQKGGRAEVNMEMPVIGKMSMVTLTHFDAPHTVYLLNERKKKYAVLEANDQNQKEEHFTITKLGKVVLHGLSCTHGKATNDDGEVFEFWTTKEIPQYQELLKVYSRSGRMGPSNLWHEMESKGIAGLMVKLLFPTPEGNAIMELREMKKMDLPESLLEIPSNYKESKGGWIKRYQKQMQ